MMLILIYYNINLIFINILKLNIFFIIFIKKNNKKIENINFLYKKNLINCIKSNSNLNLNNIKYNSNIILGYFIYINNLFLKNNYDADIDLNELCSRIN